MYLLAATLVNLFDVSGIFGLIGGLFFQSDKKLSIGALIIGIVVDNILFVEFSGRSIETTTILSSTLAALIMFAIGLSVKSAYLLFMKAGET